MRTNVFSTTQAWISVCNIIVLLTILCSNVFSQTQTYTTSGNFTVPTGVSGVRVEAWGAGGGGSTITSNNTRGGGGGGGAYASSVVNVIQNTSYSYTVGTGGAANTTGGNSFFNINNVIAAGGTGATANSVTGGAGGTVANSTGTTRFKGGAGSNGNVTASFSGAGGGGAGTTGAGGDAVGSAAGAGTATNGGNGGAGVTGSANGLPGTIYGGGGSGASTLSGANRTGGTGANGLIRISWPTISSFSDLTICAGQSLTINGVNLTNATSVLIGGVAATITSNTSTSVTVTVGAGATGNVTVTSSFGTIRSGSTITVNNAPAITSQPQTADAYYCLNQTSTPLTVSATGAGLTYQWFVNTVASNVGGTVITGAESSSYSPVTSTAGTFFYYCVVSGTCAPAVTSNVSGTISVATEASIELTSGAANAILCISNTLTQIDYTAIGPITDLVLSGSLPPGVSGVFNNGVFTITGTPTQAGTFNYTINATISACLNLFKNGTITVRDNGILTLTSASNNTQTLCINVGISNITYSIGGAGTGASVSGLPTGVVGSYNAGVFTISGAPSIAGTFPFTVNVTGSDCINESLTGTITVTGNSTLSLTSGATSNNQSRCINTSITDITYSVGGTATNTTANNLPPGINGVLNAGVFTISGTATTAGVFNYSVTNAGPCSNPIRTGTITIVAQPVVNAGNILALCANAVQATPSGALSINVTSGATAINCTSIQWSTSGSGTFTNATSITLATYTPSAADKTAGSVTLTLTGFSAVCGNVTSSKILTLGASINNNTIVLTSICKAGGLAQVDINQGASALSGGNGTFTYQWQFSSPGNSSYVNMPGETSANLSVLQPSNNGFYRRIVYSGGCSTISNRIHANANNVLGASSFSVTGGGNICSNSTGTPIGLSGSIDGLPEFTVTYKLFRDNVFTGLSVLGTGAAFNFPNQTIAGTYTITATVSVVGGNSCAASTIANNVSITISEPPVITSQPSTALVCSGLSNTISVAKSGTSASLLWQISTNNGSTWANIANGSPYSGVSTDTLRIDTTKAFMAGYLYRAVASAPTACSTAAISPPIALKIKNVWIGNTSQSWEITSNWSSNTLPDNSCSEVILLGGRPNQPRINTATGTVGINNLRLETGALLTVLNATLQVSGSIISTNAIDIGNGTLELNGAMGQNIGGSLFLSKKLGNLKISNNAGIQIAGTDTLLLVDVLSFTVSNAQLFTNGRLTLLSSAVGTASVADLTNNGANSGNDIIGNVTVERFIPNHPKAWQLLAAPTKGQTINAAWQEGNAPLANNRPGYGTIITSHVSGAIAQGFDIFTPSGATIKVYSSLTNGYDIVPSTSVPIANNKGYMLFVRGDRSVTAFNQPATQTILRSTGTLYTTGINAPPVSVIPDGKFESIGNPYASAIDFNKLAKTGGVQDVFYMWDPKLTSNGNSAYGLGGFQTFVGDGFSYTVVPGGGSYANGNTNIESGMAFLVRSIDGAGTVSFSETSKVSGSAVVTRNASRNAKQLFTRLSLVTTGGPILLAGALSQFEAGYSNSIDKMDALRLGNNGGEGLAITRNGVALVAERRSEIVVSDTIFFNLSGLKRQQYQLTFNPSDLNSGGLIAYLEDRYLNTRTSLDLVASSSVIFTVDANLASAASDRFRIVFEQARILPVTITKVTAERTGNTSVSINWDVESEINIEKYEVEKSIDSKSFNVILESSPSNNPGGRKFYQNIDKNASEEIQYYRIKATSIGGLVQYSNIAKVNALATSNTFNIYPNPAPGKRISFQFKAPKAGNYNVLVVSKTGQVVYQGLINNSSSNQVNVLHLNGSTPSGIYRVILRKGDVHLVKEVVLL